jgi:hypothetical protein
MSSSLERHFDAAILINLERRHDRRDAALEELRALGLDTYIPWISVRNKSFARIHTGHDYPSNGNAGCTRSHRDVIRAIASGPHERVLVFEDDFKVLTFEDFAEARFFVYEHLPPPVRIFASVLGTFDERLDQIMRGVPGDWDVLYLGGGYAAPPLERISPTCIRNAGMMTTGSYAITREHAKVWTAKVDADYGDPDKMPSGPIDSIFQSFARDFRYYTIQPRLFIQRAGLSDLNGEVNSYLNSMTDSAHEMMV